MGESRIVSVDRWQICTIKLTKWHILSAPISLKSRKGRHKTRAFSLITEICRIGGQSFQVIIDTGSPDLVRRFSGK